MNVGEQINREVIAQMRAWLTDCGADVDDLDHRDDLEVINAIARNYSGGIVGFLLDS